jgi:hypothetical protein
VRRGRRNTERSSGAARGVGEDYRTVGNIMMPQSVTIKLHDNSLIQVSRTEAGTIYVELLAPMTLKDGLGLAVKGSAMLTDADASALGDLLTSPAEREAA